MIPEDQKNMTYIVDKDILGEMLYIRNHFYLYVKD